MAEGTSVGHACVALACGVSDVIDFSTFSGGARIKDDEILYTDIDPPDTGILPYQRAPAAARP